MIAKTPTPPYYAVIFTNTRTTVDDGYSKMADEMLELAKKQRGYLGFESARNEIGITISYWEDLESIKLWKDNSDHSFAREQGRLKWYKEFTTRICKVEKEYSFPNTNTQHNK